MIDSGQATWDQLCEALINMKQRKMATTVINKQIIDCDTPGTCMHKINSSMYHIPYSGKQLIKLYKC